MDFLGLRTMTIRDKDKFMARLWDWAILDGCFPGSRIRPTDVDGLVERNGHFLFIEAKGLGVDITTGQEILFRRLSELPKVSVLILWGETDKPQMMQLLHNGKAQDKKLCTLEDVRSLVLKWYRKT